MSDIETVHKQSTKAAVTQANRQMAQLTQITSASMNLNINLNAVKYTNHLLNKW